MPTYNNGSNSNLDSDGKCAVVLMRVEAMKAQRALNQVISSKTSGTRRKPHAPGAHLAKTKSHAQLIAIYWALRATALLIQNKYSEWNRTGAKPRFVTTYSEGGLGAGR